MTWQLLDDHRNGDCASTCPMCAVEATYPCRECGCDTDPETDASPCEGHHVGPCCAPCPPCSDDRDEDRAIRDRREATA